MVINKLLLMKVPFDNSYSNVYDFPDGLVDNDFIFSRLTNLGFESKLIDFNGDKYFISINNNSLLTINVDYDEIKDYNYAVVGYSIGYPVYKFYFITSMKSLNSGIKPTTEISIEYDCWLNNIDKFYSSDIKQQIITGHIKETVKKENSYYPNSVYGAINDITHIETGADQPNRYKVLWMRIWMDTNDIYYKNTSGSYVNSLTKGCYITHSRTPILFVPYMVIDTLTLSAVYSYTWGNYPVDGSISVSPISNILKIDLTYYPPFTYTLSNNTISIGMQGFLAMQVGNVYVKRSDDSYTPVCIYYDHLVSDLSPTFPFEMPVVYGYLRPSGDLPSKILAEEIEISLYSLYNYTANSYLTTFNNSPLYQIYPYTYYSILCNGSSTPIVFYKNAIKCVISIYSEKISPYYIIKFYDNNDLKVYESKPVFVQNTGSILTSYSAYDSYLRNNGNQLNMQYERLKTNALKSSVNNLLSLGSSGNINSLLNNSRSFIKNSGFTAIDYYIDKKSLDARIEDIRNSQGVFNMPSIDANENIMQDLVLIRYFYPANDMDFTYIATMEQYFGKSISFSDKITNCNKKIFDFKKIINPSIPFITNINERNKLTFALENGITFWHYDSELTGDFLDSIKKFNKQINNPDREV